MSIRIIKDTKPNPEAICQEGFRFPLRIMTKAEATQIALSLGFSKDAITLAIVEGGNLHHEQSGLTLHYGEPGTPTAQLMSPLIVEKWGNP